MPNNIPTWMTLTSTPPQWGAPPPPDNADDSLDAMAFVPEPEPEPDEPDEDTSGAATACCMCGKKGRPYNKFPFARLVLGDEIVKPWVCFKCHRRANGAVYFCLGCKTGYKATKEWAALAQLSYYRILPCPKHSASKTEPLIKCSVCDHTDRHWNMNWTIRGKYLCPTHYSESDRCGAPYCGAVLHRDMPGVVTSPGGKVVYCGDCAKVRSVPEGVPPDFHPLTWLYNPLCHCAGCTHLSGKSDKWPAKARPKPTSSCAGCDTDIHPSAAIEVGTSYYCHMCSLGKLVPCKGCKQLRRRDQYHSISLINSADEAAAIKLAGHCDECIGALGGRWLCDAGCRRWYPQSHPECNCGGVFNHDYTPDFPQFLTARGQRARRRRVPFLGIELEIEAQGKGTSRKAGVKLMKSLAGDFAYAVHDGSLLGSRSDGAGGERGFELVTHPFTMEWFQDNWHRFERLLNALSQEGYRSWEGGRCGLHIHISRRPMSEGHQVRFINFIWGSVNMAMCVGGRSYKDPYLAKYAPFDAENRAHLIKKVRNFTNPGVPNNGHYTALNTNKRATLEARWFRGTLNPTRFRADVEFIHALWQFTRVYGFRAANEVNFVHWLRHEQRCGSYATIRDYLEHNYITRR